ncbi:MAG: metalloprotease PmbA, partial [Gammaproteobacteria bacterium]|nr:metalloprotease PmbA [Gammaproteobacteria bacterium]
MIDQEQKLLETLTQQILDEAKRQGATAAEAGSQVDQGYTTSVRMGDVETIEHHKDRGMGVTVYFGNRKGTASTSDFSPQAVQQTVRSACDIARYTQEDPYAGLADP